MPQDENVTSLTTLKKVLNVIDAYRILLVLSIVLAGVSVVLQLYVPVLFGRAIDGIVGAGRVDFALVGRYLTRIIALVALSSLATLIMNLINNRLTYRTVRDIRAKAIRQIQVLPLSYLDGQSIGDLVQRVIADVDQVSDGLLLGFTQLFTGIITILVTLYIMFTKNVEISLMIVVLTPVSFFAAKFIATHSYHMFRQQTAVRGRQTALINEMVGSEKVVKAFRHEAKASEQFDVLNKDLQHYTQHALGSTALTNPPPVPSITSSTPWRPFGRLPDPQRHHYRRRPDRVLLGTTPTSKAKPFTDISLRSHRAPKRHGLRRPGIYPHRRPAPEPGSPGAAGL